MLRRLRQSIADGFYADAVLFPSKKERAAWYAVGALSIIALLRFTIYAEPSDGVFALLVSFVLFTIFTGILVNRIIRYICANRDKTKPE